MGIEIRNVADGELTPFRSCIYETFGEDIEADPEGDVRMHALLPPDRRWGAYDGNTVLGTAGSFDLSIGVPGGESLAMAGLTIVTVRPTHRRRGILRDFMARFQHDTRERRYAISGLWASEAGIYGRFGYGIAAHADAISIANAGTVTLREHASDGLEWIDEAAARELLPAVYAKATAARPGALRRSDVWWRERRFMEQPFVRNGASRRRHVIARRDGEIAGYLAFRQRSEWDASGPNGKLEIIELMGIDSRAELSLWQLALSADLFPNVSWGHAPVDDPLAWAVTDQRRVQRRRTDTLWLRIEDVPAALASRAYAHDGVVRFAIGDATWELVVEHGRGRCSSTTRTPELRFADTALASIYLGGVSATQLARADQIRGDAHALGIADRLFSSAIAPWCPEVF